MQYSGRYLHDRHRMPCLSTMRLRDIALPLFGTAHMDINYTLRRERFCLHNALVAASGPARLAHKAMAAAYGQLLAESGFPHGSATIAQFRRVTANERARWEDNGGSAAVHLSSKPTPRTMSLSGRRLSNLSLGRQGKPHDADASSDPTTTGTSPRSGGRTKATRHRERSRRLFRSERLSLYKSAGRNSSSEPSAATRSQ